MDDAGAVLASAVWWGRDGPETLDDLRSSDASVDASAGLLRAAHDAFGRAPEYHLFVPADWEDDAERRAAVSWRRSAAAAAGLTDVVERLRFRWQPSCGVPEPTGRVVFRPSDDDADFADAFARVAVGSLDDGTRRSVAEVGAAEHGRREVAEYRWMEGREWWRLGYTPEGELVGLALPARNPNSYVVGFVGVVPEQRGRGYVDDLLGEITRVLAGLGAEEVRADTDKANTPMAAAFHRADWDHFAVRIVLSAPSAS